MTLVWEEYDNRIRLFGDEHLLFDDSIDHWLNGFLRLMGWSAEQGRDFAVAAVEAIGGSLIWANGNTEKRLGAMAYAAQKLYPQPEGANVGGWPNSSLKGMTALNRKLDGFWFLGMAGEADWALAGLHGLRHGVLVQLGNDGMALLPPASVYEDEYFEGGHEGFGYGNLEAQEQWRMEKARRQSRQLAHLLETVGERPEGPIKRLLDVGSGYGYLRAALAEMGWEQEGVELSRHASSVAKRLFGFSSFQGVLKDAPGKNFDVITMMDLIEHVEDPVLLLRQAHDRLSPGGICVVRTPNLLAREGEVFGHRYHSLKREHLHMFSIESLNWCFEEAGMVPVHGITEAHLFQGFLGKGVYEEAAKFRGSDIFATCRKPL